MDQLTLSWCWFIKILAKSPILFLAKRKQLDEIIKLQESLACWKHLVL